MEKKCICGRTKVTTRILHLENGRDFTIDTCIVCKVERNFDEVIKDKSEKTIKYLNYKPVIL